MRRWACVALAAAACAMAACGSAPPRGVAGGGMAATPTSTAAPRTPAPLSGAPLPLHLDTGATFVVNSDGTGLRKLSDDTNGAYVNSVASPDGRVAAVVTRTQQGAGVRSVLDLVDIASGNRTELLGDNSAAAVAGWAPDSSRFVFYRDQAISPPAAGFAVYDLKRGISGTTPFDGQFMGWAPDGSRFYFWTYGDGSAIYAADATSLSVRTLLDGVDVQSASLSPDGRTIAYASVAISESGQSSRWTIGSISVDGGSRRIISQLPASPLGLYGLEWSPDGRQIAYGWTGSDGSGQAKGVYVLDLATGKQSRITDPGAQFDAGITWSPDGRWLLIDRFSCVACDGGGPTTVLAAADGSSVTVLDKGTNLGSQAIWSPDGSQFVYEDGRLVVASPLHPTAGKPIVEMPLSEFEPTRWTATGQIFFDVLPSRDSRLYAVRTDGSSYHLLGAGESISPDGMATAARAYKVDSANIFEVQIHVERAGATHTYSVAALAGGKAPDVYLSKLIWSPDSVQLLLIVSAASSERLVVLDTRTGTSRTIADVPATSPTTPGAPVGSIFDAAWSPDGSRVAYSTASAVWTVGAAGGAAQHVLDATKGIVAWSPDGAQIAVAEDGRVSIVAADGSGTLEQGFEHMVSVSPPNPLPMNVTAMRWSPDGAWLAISDASGGRLLVMSAKDGTVTTLANAAIGDFVWSPDSRQLAYGGGCPKTDNAYGDGICLVRRDGTGAVQLTESRGYAQRPLRWRADGTIVIASVASGP